MNEQMTEKEYKVATTLTAIIVSTLFIGINLVGGVYLLSCGLSSLGFPGIISFTPQVCGAVFSTAIGIGALLGVIKHSIPEIPKPVDFLQKPKNLILSS